jgi:hypothetical protein
MDEQFQVSRITRRAPFDTVVKAGGRIFEFWAYDEAIAQLKEGALFSLMSWEMFALLTETLIYVINSIAIKIQWAVPKPHSLCNLSVFRRLIKTVN